MVDDREIENLEDEKLLDLPEEDSEEDSEEDNLSDEDDDDENVEEAGNVFPKHK